MEHLIEKIKSNEISDELKNDINTLEDINKQDNNGLTLLHYATMYHNFEIVKYLVEEKKADLDIQDNNGWYLRTFGEEKGGLTPLHIAFSLGSSSANPRQYLEIANYLIEKGASLNILSKSNKYPIDYYNPYNDIEEMRIFDEQVQGIDQKKIQQINNLFVTIRKQNDLLTKSIDCLKKGMIIKSFRFDGDENNEWSQKIRPGVILDIGIENIRVQFFQLKETKEQIY